MNSVSKKSKSCLVLALKEWMNTITNRKGSWLHNFRYAANCCKLLQECESHNLSLYSHYSPNRRRADNDPVGRGTNYFRPRNGGGIMNTCGKMETDRSQCAGLVKKSPAKQRMLSGLYSKTCSRLAIGSQNRRVSFSRLNV